MKLIRIGKIESLNDAETLNDSPRRIRSRVIIADEYAYGLKGLEKYDHVQMLVGQTRPSEFALMSLSDCGEARGIFATRHPMRPSGLQMATMRLLELTDNILTVEGHTFQSGSPVYDLMPFLAVLDADQVRLESQERLKQNPRQDFVSSVCAGDRTRLLIKAAEIHGHFCPGIALGVMASLYGLRKLDIESQTFDGIMEELLAIVEINACFADGIQAVSGCTLGNNALIYRDLGRTAVTFTMRGREKGVRIKVKPEFKAQVDRLAPDFYPLVDKVILRRQGDANDLRRFKEQGRAAAFGLIQLDFKEFLDSHWITPQLPGHAPISPLQVCPQCGENVLAGKMAQEPEGSGKCLECAGQPYYQVDGRGIVKQ